MAELYEKDIDAATTSQQLLALKEAFNALNKVTAIYYWDKYPDAATARQMNQTVESALDKMKGILK